MSMNDTIKALEKMGVVDIHILFANRDRPLCLQASQVIPTGPEGNYAAINHQVVSPDLVECFETLKVRAEHGTDLKTEIIQLPKRN